jgi:Ca2+-binding RTX toxin-like protein
MTVSGDDLLTGGDGHDAFVFAPGFRRDVIINFAGGMRVGGVFEFSGLGATLDTFAELMAVATQSGANTVISIDASNNIALQNVARMALVANDFRFT